METSSTANSYENNNPNGEADNSDLSEVFGSDTEEFDSEESRDSTFSSIQSSVALSSDPGDDAMLGVAMAYSFAGATDGSSRASSISGGSSIPSPAPPSSENSNAAGSHAPVVAPQMLSTVYVPVLQEVHTLVSYNGPLSSPNSEVYEVSSDEDGEEQRRVWRRLGHEQKLKRKLEAARENNTAKRNCEGPGGSSEGAQEKEATENDSEATKVAMCSVCLEEIDDGGDHRLVALKCGHPFGENCVRKWLESVKQSCPLCNRHAKVKDIRVVFLDCSRVGSSYELAEARKEAADLRTMSAQQKEKVHEVELQLGALKSENSCLRDRLRTLERGAQRRGSLTDVLWRSSFPNNSSFTRLTGSCKYMAYSESLSMVAVSMRPRDGLFGGYGVELCSLYDLTFRHVKVFHRQEIKDLSFHPNRQWLLTAAMDNSARINDVVNFNLTNVHNIQLDTKVWSCCWSQTKDTNFYLGLASGAINEYDVRRPSEPFHVLKGPASRLPIVSLKSFHSGVGPESSRPAGVMCTQLRSTVRLYRESNQQDARYFAHDIPVRGNCFSLCYDNDTSSLLVSSRMPSNQTVTNQVLELNFENGGITSTVQSAFKSGGSASIITKPVICRSHSDEMWACCMDDRAKSIQVFSCSDGVMRHNLHTQDPLQEQLTQVEKIKIYGKSQFALLGLSLNGFSLYV